MFGVNPLNMILTRSQPLIVYPRSAKINEQKQGNLTKASTNMLKKQPETK